jgi:hypothetical protein
LRRRPRAVFVNSFCGGSFFAPKLARIPYPTICGIRFVLDQIAVRDPEARSVAPESFMDLRFVKSFATADWFRAFILREDFAAPI